MRVACNATTALLVLLEKFRGFFVGELLDSNSMFFNAMEAGGY